MKAKLLGAITLAVVLLLVFAVVAQAAVPQSTIDAIIQDAKDGHIDGNWTTAEIRAALRYVANNPILANYTRVQGVLEDYLASLQAPGEQGGQLAFTGGEIILILGAGAGLIGSGVRCCAAAAPSSTSTPSERDRQSASPPGRRSVHLLRLSVSAVGAPSSATTAAARRPRSPASDSAARRIPAR